ncbi:hypothetical protein CMK12_08500 [Candidatus Poribacteria bacterium]|nr:hypothetical protein [Candidatus Poribacteria bacterium]
MVQFVRSSLRHINNDILSVADGSLFLFTIFVLIAEKQPPFFDRLNEGSTMLEISGVRYSSFCNARVWITKSASHFFNASVMLK